MIVTNYKDVCSFFQDLMNVKNNFNEDGSICSDKSIYLEICYINNEIHIIPASTVIFKYKPPNITETQTGIIIKHIFHTYYELLKFTKSEKQYNEICKDLLYRLKQKIRDKRIEDISTDFIMD